MELKTDNVIYHVESFGDLVELANKLDKLGCRWCDNTLLTNFNCLLEKFNRYKRCFCLCVDNKKATYSDLYFYNSENLFKDYIFIKYKRNEQIENEKQQSNRKQDAIGNAIQALEKQYKKGLERYGETIEECDYSAQELFQMAQEEMADGLIYTSEALERLNKERNDIKVDVEMTMSDIKTVADSMNNCQQKDKLLGAYTRLNHVRKKL